MMLFIGGIILFFGIHSVSIINAGWRERMVTQVGLLPWQGIYAVVAIIGFVLLINGYQISNQSPIVLYHPPDWLSYVASLLMIAVFPLLLATYLPGRIQSTTRHPMLIATKTWALAHLLTNGNLADVMLFGAFLAWAITVRISLKRRTAMSTPGLPRSSINDVLVIVLGLGLYAAFVLGLHAWLFGVSPLA